MKADPMMWPKCSECGASVQQCQLSKSSPDAPAATTALIPRPTARRNPSHPGGPHDRQPSLDPADAYRAGLILFALDDDDQPKVAALIVEALSPSPTRLLATVCEGRAAIARGAATAAYAERWRDVLSLSLHQVELRRAPGRWPVILSLRRATMVGVESLARSTTRSLSGPSRRSRDSG